MACNEFLEVKLIINQTFFYCPLNLPEKEFQTSERRLEEINVSWKTSDKIFLHQEMYVFVE